MLDYCSVVSCILSETQPGKQIHLTHLKSGCLNGTNFTFPLDFPEEIVCTLPGKFVSKEHDSKKLQMKLKAVLVGKCHNQFFGNNVYTQLAIRLRTQFQ